MKKLLLLTFLCSFTLLSIAQVKFNTSFMYGRSNAAIKGGKEGKLYAAIIKSDMSKKAIVDKTTKFLLNHNLVSAKDIHLDEISQKTSEYKIPFCFTQTQFYSNMGVMQPVRLYGTLRFEFHDGGLLLVADNMNSSLLCVSYHGTPAERGESYNAYIAEQDALIMTKTIIGKVLIWANTTAEEQEEFYKKTAEYFNKQDEKIDVYNKLVNSGEAKWMDAKELQKYITENPSPGSKYQLQWLENSVIPSELLVGIGNKRWEKQIREEYFDNLFITLSHYINGYIEAIKEDDTETWKLDGKSLLPTDPKLKTTFIKKNKDFYLK